MILQGVTPKQFDAVRRKLIESHQAEVTGTDAGVITGHGVTAEYTYDPGSQSLTIEVKRHPFFIPVSAIESRLREEFKS